ncbi:Uncharacterised protein [Serratia marcescens]|nr:hypothetical protein [Serratia marcescens]ONK19849.1 hypothetical protein BHT35_1400 [Serratia sp. S119]KMJ09059.1 hypothetical protein SN05_00488 [Serratia marcescens]OUI56388.1 hypothetical protein AZZ98_000202 [Serratia marcescens]CAI1647868.1 Uncharacterised protein [Serratia marcescens]CAI1721183.1 Uncharacterised protein [Serratia marcescens]
MLADGNAYPWSSKPKDADMNDSNNSAANEVKSLANPHGWGCASP